METKAYSDGVRFVVEKWICWDKFGSRCFEIMIQLTVLLVAGVASTSKKIARRANRWIPHAAAAEQRFDMTLEAFRKKQSNSYSSVSPQSTK